MHYKILIVEDNPINMELATDLLEAEGHSVVQAFDAEAGIILAIAESPDVILMDLALPGIDGLQATRILRSTATTQQRPIIAQIPILALTAHAMHGDAAKAAEAGCVGYLTKPIDTRTFVGTVVRFAEGKWAVERAA